MIETYPSPVWPHRRADMYVHALGLGLIAVAGSALLVRGIATLPITQLAALCVYILAALASNLASWAYHFAPWHPRRVLLRRIDHAAIYPSIAGSFTPFFVQAGTPWTLFLLAVSWVLTAAAIWNKLSSHVVKSRWSTASYLGLGAVGLLAIPDLRDVPLATLYCIGGGALSYVIGTGFYTRKSLPYRYAIWHLWVNIGATAMFAGIWLAVF